MLSNVHVQAKQLSVSLSIRDPYIMHLDIALYMVVSLYFGVEKATCFKWLQHVSFKEPCVCFMLNHRANPCHVRSCFRVIPLRLAPLLPPAGGDQVPGQRKHPEGGSRWPPFGYESKLNNPGTAAFSPCFHLPRFHFGYPFLTHSHVSRPGTTERKYVQ